VVTTNGGLIVEGDIDGIKEGFADTIAEGDIDGVKEGFADAATEGLADETTIITTGSSATNEFAGTVA